MREKIDSFIGKFIYALLWFLTFATMAFGMFVLSGCGAPPLTEQEQFNKDYKEADRKNLYVMWEKDCLDNNGIIYSFDVSRFCHVGRCIPHKRDWSYNSKRERPSTGNRVVCISQKQLDDMLR